MANINDEFFDGAYKDLWKAFIPEDLTKKEAEFMLSYFHLNKESKVLDLMCGYGRHAIALARNGVQVTAVDNLEAYISELNETVIAENLPVKPILQKALDFETDEKFDLIICMGNSFNFFSPEEASKLLSFISQSLKPSGHFLINSWSISEIAFKTFRENSWSVLDNKKFLVSSKMLFPPTRIETESIIISPDGSSEEKTGIDYIYSLNEMEFMIQNTGLIMQQAYSIPGKKPFSFGDPRVYIIAQKSES